MKTFKELDTEYQLGLHLRATTPDGIAYVYLANGHMEVITQEETNIHIDAWFNEKVWELCRVPDEVLQESE